MAGRTAVLLTAPLDFCLCIARAAEASRWAAGKRRIHSRDRLVGGDFPFAAGNQLRASVQWRKAECDVHATDEFIDRYLPIPVAVARADPGYGVHSEVPGVVSLERVAARLSASPH